VCSISYKDGREG
jgi:hypothetical protein